MLRVFKRADSNEYDSPESAMTSSRPVHEARLTIEADVLSGFEQRKLTVQYLACPYPVVPLVGESIGLLGVAVTGTVVGKCIFQERIHLQVHVNLDGLDWEFAELLAALIDQGFSYDTL